MLTQFSDSNYPVSVLYATNMYSLISSIYFHWSLLSISWQWIYNTSTVDKSSNHTLSLHRLTSTTNFPWLFLSANCLTVILGTLLYSHGTDTHHRKHAMWPLLLCDITVNHRKHMSCDPYTLLSDILCMYHIAMAHSWTWRKHFHSTVSWRTCWLMPTGLLPSDPWANPMKNINQ
jgi:hypothetical protein